jgi:hypothetical protein
MAHEGDEFIWTSWFYTKIYSISVILTTAQKHVLISMSSYSLGSNIRKLILFSLTYDLAGD